MTNYGSIHSLLKVALLVSVSSLTGCPGEPGEDAESTATTTGPGTTGDGTTTDDPMTTTLPPEGSGTVGPETTGGPDDSSGGEEFEFPDDPYDAYTQIDRHGAVEAGTAGILAPEGLGFNPGSDISLRDMYNASNPAEDAAGMWLGEITDSVTFFHNALDDDLMALMLTPADVDTALMQAGPVIVPDTIKYDPANPTAYPNGRTLEDPVVDITLAAVLIELGPMQPLSLFADLPLNPPANDVPFEAEFPYLAAPHPPK